MGGGKEVGSLANEFTESCEMLHTKEIKLSEKNHPSISEKLVIKHFRSDHS